MKEVGLFEAIYTTRAIKRFAPDPVPDSLLRQVLEAACQAPSGGNGQPWRFVVVRSPEGKRNLEELMQRAEQIRMAEIGVPNPSSAGRQPYNEVPVVIMVCSTQTQTGIPHAAGPFGSTFPAVQNLLLAARALGLGGSITTNYRWGKDGFLEYLKIPEELDTVALVPLGYPDEAQGIRHGKKTRKPLETVAYEEEWGRPIKV
jgi:nitroreductase